MDLICVARYTAVFAPLLGFTTSYIFAATHGWWEYLGTEDISKLAGVDSSELISLHIHVLLSLSWVFLSNYALYSKGKGYHKWAGRIAVVMSVIMLPFAPKSSQMSSCWPHTFYIGANLSHDTFVVGIVSILMLLSLGLGWYSRTSKCLKEEHAQFMAHGVLFSNSPAMMRIISFVPLYIASHLSKEENYLMSVGYWLLVKEFTYLILSLIGTIPVFIYRWSPYTRAALELTKPKMKQSKFPVVYSLFCLSVMILLLLFQISMFVRFFSYLYVLGAEGGNTCFLE